MTSSHATYYQMRRAYGSVEYYGEYPPYVNVPCMMAAGNDSNDQLEYCETEFAAAVVAEGAACTASLTAACSACAGSIGFDKSACRTCKDGNKTACFDRVKYRACLAASKANNCNCVLVGGCPGYDNTALDGP